MWFGALPSLAIVGVALCSFNTFNYFTNKFFLGNAYKRSLFLYDDGHHFLRDMRISGVENPYKQKGLDSLPDENDGNKETTSTNARINRGGNKANETMKKEECD